MGLMDRLRGTPPEEPWQPPVLGSCRCEAHIETLADQVIPARPPMTFAELGEAVEVAPQEPPFVHDPTTGQRRGPFQWCVDLDERASALHEVGAPATLDDLLFIQPGVDNVLRLDDHRLLVGAPDLCASGLLAALATALANPRVRRPT